MARRAFVVVGLGLGDEGKGTVTDYLARRHGAGLVVRFNGGPQAGHNVVAPEGTWHCFAQFGAGHFQPGTRAAMSGRTLVELEALRVEGDVLAAKGVADPYSRLALDPDATVITPWHKMVGQMQELARGADRVGSCGMGVGQAVRWAEQGLQLRVADVASPPALRGLLAELQARAESEARAILAACSSPAVAEIHAYFRGRGDADRLAASYEDVLARTGVRVASTLAELDAATGPVIFEGAQGALLDRTYGFTPYVTQTRTTCHQAMDLLGAAPAVKIGVIRPYAHRHGPGPLPTEAPAAALGQAAEDPYNLANRWQGPFRTGWFDLPAIRYGILLNEGVDELALTNLDRLSGRREVRLCLSYEYEGDLGPLHDFFLYEPLAPRRARITGFKPPLPPPAPGLADLLARCRPLDWHTLPGWQQDISGVQAYSDLPANARDLVACLESAQGLGVKAGIVSVSPTALGKLDRHEARG